MLKKRSLAAAFVVIAATPAVAADSTPVKNNPPPQSVELAQLPAPCDCEIRYRNCVQAAREPGGVAETPNRVFTAQSSASASRSNFPLICETIHIVRYFFGNSSYESMTY